MVICLIQASMVHSLLASYNLLKRVTVVNSKPATYHDLREFHSELYLDHLKTIKNIDEDYNTDSVDEEYGLGLYTRSLTRNLCLLLLASLPKLTNWLKTMYLLIYKSLTKNINC